MYLGVKRIARFGYRRIFSITWISKYSSKHIYTINCVLQGHWKHIYHSILSRYIRLSSLNILSRAVVLIGRAAWNWTFPVDRLPVQCFYEASFCAALVIKVGAKLSLKCPRIFSRHLDEDVYLCLMKRTREREHELCLPSVLIRCLGVKSELDCPR